MSASLRDVARRAKVSTGTVSNVLNRPEIVAPETLERVHRAINELNFVPNSFVRHLRLDQSRTIGLIVPDISNPFYTEVSRGVEDAANRHNYAVFLCNSDGSPFKEENYISVLLDQRVRGVLIAPAAQPLHGLELLKSNRIGLALLDHKSINSDECSVSVDHVRGGEIAIQHLVELGHRRIAWITGSDDLRQCADRGRGVANAVERAGVDLNIVQLQVLNTAQGEEAARKILSLEEVPTAIFCANDILAFGVFRELIHQRIRVPEEISLLGYDDISFAPTAAVPLSSIYQPAYQLGFTATELLVGEFEDPIGHVHQQIVFQPKLVVRASTSKRSGGQATGIFQEISA
jgi:LacI family transcriptional regulator